MNLVFMNSLEKKAGDRVVTGQVSICEQQGQWHLLWHEPDEQGEMRQSDWYEGASWGELLAVYHYHIAAKIGEGFQPLLEGRFQTADLPSGKNKFAQMLEFYSAENGNPDLFQSLRKWRWERASKLGIPSYLIATNRVLRMIACFLPRNRQELLQIPGMGESKVEIYGEEMLQWTQEVERKTAFPLDWVPAEVDREQFRMWLYKRQETKLKTAYAKQVHREKLLECVSRGERLSALDQALPLTRRELLAWVEDLEKEGYDMAPLIEAELNDVPGQEIVAALKLFEEQGDRYLKPVVLKMYSEEEIGNKNLDGVYEWLRLLRLRYRRQKREEARAS